MLTTGKEQNYLVPILPETQCQMRYFVLLNTVFQILRIVGIKKCLLNEEDVQIRKCLINANKMKRKKKAQESQENRNKAFTSQSTLKNDRLKPSTLFEALQRMENYWRTRNRQLPGLFSKYQKSSRGKFQKRLFNNCFASLQQVKR